ncbi:MAG TPA: stage III sporulation protein AA [Bacillota bacterium]
MEEILRLFPNDLRKRIATRVANRWDVLQEIRIRLFQPVEFVFDEHVEWLEQMKPNRQHGAFMLNRLSEFSLYRLEDELREGYITIEGGHRVGLAGKVNTIRGTVKALHHITFLNIRIAKEKIDAARSVLPYMCTNYYVNTLIAGPPQTGKTTLIRDLVRLISSGWRNIAPKKVGLIDERSEIAASIKGIPQHDLGRRTDVLDACPKAEGMMMMIRSMSPEILVVDEIGSTLDVEALLEAIHAGVTVVCTVHGQSLRELKQRPSLRPLFQQKIFERIILLGKHEKTPGKVIKVYDESEVNIFSKERIYSR